MPVACDDRPSGETAMGIPIAYPAISRDACSAKADILKTHATVPALSAGALSLAALRLSTAQSIRALASRPGAASAARNRRDMSVIRFQTGCWKPEASQARKPLANAWTCATVTRSSPYSPILTRFPRPACDQFGVSRNPISRKTLCVLAYAERMAASAFCHGSASSANWTLIRISSAARSSTSCSSNRPAR